MGVHLPDIQNCKLQLDVLQVPGAVRLETAFLSQPAVTGTITAKMELMNWTVPPCNNHRMWSLLLLFHPWMLAGIQSACQLLVLQTESCQQEKPFSTCAKQFLL